MPDPFLCGNGRPCPACNGEGVVERPAPHPSLPPYVLCPDCAGSGRVALEPAEILAATMQEARR